MSVKLIAGPWDPGNNSQRARGKAHVTRDMLPVADTREVLGKRLVDSITPRRQPKPTPPKEPAPVIGHGINLPELRQLLESCKHLTVVDNASNKELKEAQERMAQALDLPAWPGSLIDWGLLPGGPYKAQRRVTASAETAVSGGYWKAIRLTPGEVDISKKSAKKNNSEKKLSGKHLARLFKIEENTEEISEEKKLELAVKFRHLLGTLDHELTQLHVEEKHSKSRMKVLDETHKCDVMVAPVGKLALKQARRYRRPHRSSANLPITASRESITTAKEQQTNVQKSETDSKKERKTYTPIERAFQRRSATYESQMRRLRNKEASVNRARQYYIDDPKDEFARSKTLSMYSLRSESQPAFMDDLMKRRTTSGQLRSFSSQGLTSVEFTRVTQSTQTEASLSKVGMEQGDNKLPQIGPNMVKEKTTDKHVKIQPKEAFGEPQSKPKQVGEALWGYRTPCNSITNSVVDMKEFEDSEDQSAEPVKNILTTEKDGQEGKRMKRVTLVGVD